MSMTITPLSGMQAAQLSMQASANNIANLATPGYRREVVSSTADPAGGVQAGVSKAGPSDGDPTADLVGLLAAKNDFVANVTVFKRENQALGTLLDVGA